jgi:hypothetical protein
VRLTDLDPRWVGAGGEGIRRADGSPAPERHGVGVLFDCPCGQCRSRCFVPFNNPVDGLGPWDPTRALWQRTGDTFDTLATTPSILRSKDKGGCGWHGYIGLSVPGEVTTC